MYQSQQGIYQPPPGGPPPRKGGIPPLGIFGIVAAIVVLAVVGVAAIIGLAANGGGNTATATPGATVTTVANATPTTASGGTTATASTGGSTAVAIARSSTPGSATVASPTVASATVRPTGSASGTPRPSVSAGSPTPFPTASGKVKLAPGKPLPTTVLPQIYVDHTTRYTMHFPAEWTEGPGDENTDVQFAVNGTTLAGITSEDLDGEAKPTVQQIADELSDSFSRELTNFKLTDTSQVKVGNMDAVRMLYTFTDKNNTVTLGGYLLAYSTDETLVLFEGYESNATFNSLVPTFDTVAASFTGGVSLTNSYSNAQKGLSFDYPDGWSEKKSSVSAVIVLVAPDAGIPSFNVISENAGNRTLQQYYDANIRTISTFKSYKKVTEGDATIGGQPAKLQIYTADVAGTGNIAELHQWFIVKDGVGYVLTYSVPVDSAQQFAGTGPAIASTFKFS